MEAAVSILLLSAIGTGLSFGWLWARHGDWVIAQARARVRR